jgi:hypothetical protein
MLSGFTLIDLARFTSMDIKVPSFNANLPGQCGESPCAYPLGICSITNSVALATLFTGIGLVALLVLSI